MGWDEPEGRTLDAIVKEFTEDALAHAVVNDRWNDEPGCIGRVIYAVRKSRADGRKFVAVTLLREYIAGEWKGSWSCKEMHEDEGPRAYNCPLHLLDVADPPLPAGTPLGWGAEWREEVKRFHAHQALNDADIEQRRMERNRKERERSAARRAAAKKSKVVAKSVPRGSRFVVRKCVRKKGVCWDVRDTLREGASIVDTLPTKVAAVAVALKLEQGARRG